jgi:hypothetical protein
VLRESDPQTTIWELLLPAELKRLPAELARVDAYLDDERFIAPFRALFDQRLGGCSAHEDWWAGGAHGGLRSVIVGGWRRP